MNLNGIVTEVKAIQPGARRFEVDPAMMYPAALADLRDAVMVSREVSTALETYKRMAVQLDPESWELALVPRGELASQPALRARAAALDLARLWFTEYLHRFIDHGPLEIRILKDEDWKL